MFLINYFKKIKLIDLFIIILLATSTLIFLYIHYKSYYVFGSKRLHSYIIYYLFAFLGIIIFLFIFFLKNIELKKNIVLLIYTLLFLTIFSEILIRLFFKIPTELDINKALRENKAKVIFEKFNQKIDTRSPIEVQRDLAKEGIDAALLVTPFRMLPNDGIPYIENDNLVFKEKILPLSGISNKIYVGGAESGKYKFYKTDRYGFNNLDADWDKDNNILIIGDSFAHGGYLDFKDNFVGNLKKLSKGSVISLAQPNNGPLLSLASLKEYGQKVNPKIILWMYYEGNDLVEVIEEEKSKLLSKYLSKEFNQDLISKQKNIEKSYSLFVSKRLEELDLKNVKNKKEIFSLDNNKNNTLLSIIKLQRIRSIIFDDLAERIKNFEKKNSVSYLKEVLIQAKNTSDNINADLYFIYLPSSTRYLKDYNYDLKRQNYHRKDVINLLKELNINLIDIYDNLFKNHSNPLSFFHFEMHSHYNKKAVEEISLEIYNQIKIN